MQAEYRTTEPIPLWITGHSLGSALASLLYYRLLAVPKDLLGTTSSSSTPARPLIVLRDGYLYGTPSIGSSAFLSSFCAISSKPLNRPTNLWRIVNGWDAVAMVPPGVAEAQVARGGKGVGEWSVLNFGHIGQQIILGSRAAEASALKWIVGIGGDGGVVAVTGAMARGGGTQWEDNWLQTIISRLPSLIYDHRQSRPFPSLVTVADL